MYIYIYILKKKKWIKGLKKIKKKKFNRVEDNLKIYLSFSID